MAGGVFEVGKGWGCEGSGYRPHTEQIWSGVGDVFNLRMCYVD